MQPRAELHQLRDKIGEIKIVGKEIDCHGRVGERRVEEVVDERARLEAKPVVDALAAIVAEIDLFEVEAIVGLRRDDVRSVAELFAVGLGRGEVAGEADVENAVVSDRMLVDAERDRDALHQRAITRHVHAGGAIAIDAVDRLPGEVHPTELLDQRLGGGEQAVATGAGTGRIGEVQPVVERGIAIGAGALHLKREPDERVLLVIHVHAHQSHPLATPQIKAEAILFVGVLVAGHGSPMQIRADGRCGPKSIATSSSRYTLVLR